MVVKSKEKKKNGCKEIFGSSMLIIPIYYFFSGYSNICGLFQYFVLDSKEEQSSYFF